MLQCTGLTRLCRLTLQGLQPCNLGSTYCSVADSGNYASHTFTGQHDERQMKTSSKARSDFSSRVNKLENSSAAVRKIHIKLPTETTLDSKKTSSNGHHATEEEKLSTTAVLYKNHIPTNFFQKAVLSIGAAGAALLDPRRHDMVAVLGETTGYKALSAIYTKMAQDDEGQQVLIDKPRISSSTVDLKYLSHLPEETLGHFYIKFLNDNNVTPDSRLPVQFVDNPELAYVMLRYREAHDLFHTVLGMPTNMLGEVAVKWVEALQTDLPMCYGAALFGPLRFRPKQRQKYLQTYLPWALRVGTSSKLLMNIYFEKRWEQSMSELRDELNIEPLKL